MKKSRLTGEQRIGALQQLDAGAPAKDVARELGGNVRTRYRRRKKFGRMDVSDAKRLKHLEEENRQLKRLVADLSLDDRMVKDLSSRQW